MKNNTINIKSAGSIVSAFFMACVAILLTQACMSSSVQDSSHQMPPVQERVKQKHDTIETPTLLSFTKKELLGQFEPSKHPDFVRIDKKFTTKDGIYMRKEAYTAFVRMYEAAAKDGIQLSIISATRNFNYQKGIWERKWNDEKLKNYSDMEKAENILQYSSMPGTSRHHWGTDVDFNSVSPEYFKSGKGKELYNWLVKNAGEYGFAQTYTSKQNGRSGYNEEAWHWSYMPLSKVLLTQYNEKISYEDLKGFKGDHTAKLLSVIELYVNGIDERLKK